MQAMRSAVVLLGFLGVAFASVPAADVPELIPVPAGRYDIGLRNTSGYAGGTGDAPGVHSYYDLSAYRIGKTEISNAEFCAVLNWGLQQKRLQLGQAGVLHGDKVLLDMRSSWCRIQPDPEGRLLVRGEYGRHPVTEVTWHGAMAYCALLNEREKLPQAVDLQKWTVRLDQQGYRLPTEVEWEVAAMGGKAMTRGKKGPESGLLEYTRPEARNLHAGSKTIPTGTTLCGSLPATGFGTHDMVGNVWEWCADQYVSLESLYYGIAIANWDTNGSREPLNWTFKKIPVPKDPVYDSTHMSKLLDAGNRGKAPLNAEHRIYRGGAWTMGTGLSNPERSLYRRGDRPELSTNDLGFRVARSGEFGADRKASPPNPKP